MRYNKVNIQVELLKSFAREIIITIVLAVIIFVGARQMIQTYEVHQMSMEPNFHEAQRVVVSKAAYFWNEPGRGDVIIFEAPISPGEDFIKRVIGLPGDTVEVKNGKVYVNDIAIEEPYLAAPPAYTMSIITVPEGMYFVLGDNRNQSNDSHNGWFVEEDAIHGKAWLSSWPPSLWGVVPKYDLDDQVDPVDNA